MTVQQLIEKLSEIEDKQLEVSRVDQDYWDYFKISEIEVVQDPTKLMGPHNFLVVLK